MNNVIILLDELERLVEKGFGFMGQRMVHEEAFFTQMQRVRLALAPRAETRVTSKRAEDFIAESSLLSELEQLQIVVALAGQLAAKTK